MTRTVQMRRSLIATLLLALVSSSFIVLAQPGETTSGNFSLKFDGIDDRLAVNPFPIITGPFTAEAWIQLGTGGGGINPRIVELVGAQDTTFRLQLDGNQQGLLERPVDLGLGFAPSGGQQVASAFLLVPGRWYHVAGVYDGSQQLLYVDGVLAASGPAAGVLRTNTILDIGTGVVLTGDRDTFDGLIDEVRIWNFARTQAEIRSTMFVELTGQEEGLLGYWQFNEGAGQVAHDSTANGHDAQLGSTPEPDSNDPTWVAAGAPLSTNVSIDIKPDSFPNNINPRSQGVLPVAILTIDTFNTTTVNAATVRFGKTGKEALPVRVAVEDVNGDGRPDLLLNFNNQNTGIECGDTSASLTGKTFSGQEIEGSDAIQTVGCR